MNKEEALARMIPPGMKRVNKPRGGVIQIHITRACDKSCFNCTQGSNLGGKVSFMPLDQFEQAVLSLKDYFGVVGVFGGNPALHPKFEALCEILRHHIPLERRGLWCNNPVNASKCRAMRGTFNPVVSNLNVHLDREAYNLFKSYWPESSPFGLNDDSRHSPCYTAMCDLIPDEGKRWDLISTCDINQHWSAMIGMFRGQLRAWFCEIAGAQSILHQEDPSYPDTGYDPTRYYNANGLPTAIDEQGQSVGLPWWALKMSAFADQVQKHCHECGVPLRGYGSLAVWGPGAMEQVTVIHQDIYKPKRKGIPLQLVTDLAQIRPQALPRMTEYLQNAKR